MRKKKAKSFLRQSQASIWLTETEYALLSEIADKAGMPVSSFCRNIVLEVMNQHKKKEEGINADT